MDISTTKNLITKMMAHLESIELGEPNEPSFEINMKNNIQKGLFD